MSRGLDQHVELPAAQAAVVVEPDMHRQRRTELLTHPSAARQLSDVHKDPVGGPTPSIFSVPTLVTSLSVIVSAYAAAWAGSPICRPFTP
jgi:hypothetical protein